jgi:hypothetical protein
VNNLRAGLRLRPLMLRLLEGNSAANSLRACFKNTGVPAARDFGCGQDGEVLPHWHQASPKRAVRNEPSRMWDHGQKNRRPACPPKLWRRRKGFVAKAGLALLLLGHRAPAAMLPRCASPYRPWRQNRHPRIFKTGSEFLMPASRRKWL